MCFLCFSVLPGSAEAQVISGGIARRLLIACFIGNISAKNIKTSGYATWFTVGGATHIGHYDVIVDVITRKV